MHINIKDILAGETGHRKNFKISDEYPNLPDLSLADGLNGAITITLLDEGVLVTGQSQAGLKLECHRCLRPFTQLFQIDFNGQYKLGAIGEEGEEWPIAKDLTIDLAPLIRQELFLALPIQLVDNPDCPGLCETCGQLNEPDHKHTKERKLNGST